MSSQRVFSILALGASLALAAPAGAATRAFSAGSLVVPMDLCYQPTQGSGGWTQSGGGWLGGATWKLPGGLPSSYCPDPVATPGNGVLRAYGLVFTLLENLVPVYYAVEPTKTSVAGVDLTITNAAGTPVQRINNATGAGAEFMTAGNTSVSFRGAPFIIDVADVAKALALIAADARSASPQFNQVNVYLTKVNFNAPLKGVLTGPPPLIALNGLDPTNVTILEAYLADAGLSTNKISYWPTVGSAFTVLGYGNGNGGGYGDFTKDDALKAGRFKVVWSPHWEGASSLNGNGSNLSAVLAKMSAFADAGNSVFAECVGMSTIEGGVASKGNAPKQNGDPNGHFLTTANATTTALSTNALDPVGGNWPQAAGESLVTPAAEATNPIIQFGDYVINSVSGFTEDFVPSAGVSYVPGIHRLLYTNAAAADPAAYNNRDIVITGYKNGNSSKGQVVYLAGHRYDSGGQEDNGGAITAAERIPLNTLLFLGQINSTQEQTRSSPIVYGDGKTYLGTYVYQSLPAAAFPPWQGHFREYAAGALAGTNVTAFASAAGVDWDAATHITAQATADARTIFTAIPVGGRLTQTAFTTGNAAQLGIAAATVTAIRKGGLGGIDHSIPAIIPASSLAGSPTRPTVAYVGALDGMLHAILVSGNVAGKTPGDELWAFIPNSQLSKVVTQSAGVDGSPNVGDAFIDTGAGVRSWRTVLAIPDGTWGGTVDALDITDPLNPTYLWTASDTVTINGKTFVMGRAQGAALSPILTGNSVKFAFTFATDDTNGMAGNAFNLYAVDASNGSVIWRFNHLYSNDTTHNDVPGTAVPDDSTGQNGTADKVYFGDIEGKVWAVSAATGPGGSPTAPYGAALANNQGNSVNFPIESAVVLYRDPSTQHLDVLGVTGGADWVPSSTLSYVFKYDTQTAGSSNLAALGVGERAYAVPTISGNSAYLITSVGAINGSSGTSFNAAGYLTRINLGATAGVTQIASVKQGASEVAVDGSGNVVAASASGITQNANGGRDTSQPTYSLQNRPRVTLAARAWLDFH